MKLLNILFSTKTMTFLLIVFATTMGIATFVESSYGTPTTQAYIYKTKWFETIMILLIFNFIGNIERYKLYTWKKLPTLLIHISFIIMAIGAFITRYYSFEGQIDIEEGKTAQVIRSYETFFKYMIKGDNQKIEYGEDPYILSPLHKDFTKDINYNGTKIEFKVLDYIQEKYSEGHHGVEIITKMGGQDGQQSSRESEILMKGDILEFDGQKIGFESTNDSIMNIITKDNELYLKAPYSFGFYNMMKNKSGEINPNELTKIEQILYSTDKARFVILPTKINNIIIAELKSGNETKRISFSGSQFDTNYSPNFEINGLQISLGYGSSWLDKKYQLPFKIRLNDFQLEKYPGSNNPSSYASEVSVIDGETIFPSRIFMNNILNYKGYRFYQSSYSISPEGKETTILSVNADFWGTTISYLGYLIMTIGMLLTLVWNGSYFKKLGHVVNQIKKRKEVLSIIFLLSFVSINAQTHTHEDGSVHDNNHNPVEQKKETHTHKDGTIHDANHKQVTHDKSSEHKIDMHGKNPNGDNIKGQKSENIENNTHNKEIFNHEFPKTFKIDLDHSKKLEKILVQDQQGRIKPIHTYADKLITEIHGSKKIDSLNAVQAYLSLTFETSKWYDQPIILIGKKGGKELRDITKAVEKNGKWYTSMINIISNDSNNPNAKTLYDTYEQSFNKADSDKTDFDKEVLKIIQRVSIIEGMGKGSYFWVIPDLKSINNDWNSWADHENNIFKEGQKYVSNYFNSILEARKTNDWSKADENLEKISNYQRTEDIEIPSKEKVELEILYNKFHAFKISIALYTIAGLFLLVIALLKLNSNSKTLSVLGNIFTPMILIGFVIHTLGLAVRWYISGHAPWSNGYEAVIFVSWTTVLSSIIFAYKNYFVISSGAMMGVLIMAFSFLSTNSPAVTNLAPVLKSYWLVIHVAVITSSYGFLGLSTFLGFINLILMSIRNKNNYTKITLNIKELTAISQMSMIIGLYTLSIGTFLGGIWANESWGRYWSWDPKETWAFISMFVYAVVTHMRLVPGLRGYFIYNIAAIFSFASILMTFIGVNYFLSGMHSYGSGDPVPIIEWVAPITIIILTLAFFAKRNEIKDNK